MTLYRTIVADPPWDVGRGPDWGSNGASRPLTYPTMSVEEIAALPVRSLAEKGSHLYLWTINAYVEDAYEIARLWGFRPSTLLTWCKPPNGIGLGGDVRTAHAPS
jgi:N6-adenosine-specific RNA methylase IME4